MSHHFGEGVRKQVTKTLALTAGLLERAGDVVSFQTGLAESGEIPPEAHVPAMEVPVRIHYADGSARTHRITFKAGTTVENGQLNRTGSWSPQIRIEVVNGVPQASF